MSGNIWQLFKQLTDTGSQQLATVTVRNGTTSYTVQMASGNYVDVVGKGAFEVGSKVFIKDGEITMQAPSLAYFETEV